MIGENDINKIKEIVTEFFSKMTMPLSGIEVLSAKEDAQDKDLEAIRDSVDIDIVLDEPQILIGQGGQTLSEIQRLLRMVLNKRLEKIFYFNVDINEYKKKKIEYLKDLAKSSADYVAATRQEKALTPMSAFERRIIHAELSKRTDVKTESQGGLQDRHIVIKPN